MELNEFMNEVFHALDLKPPLFYSWDIGIRFELGVEWKREYDYPDNPYVLECYKRAITLFEYLHSPTEDIFVVLDVNDFNNGKNISSQLGNFPKYINKSFLYRLKHHVLPYIFPEDDEDGTIKTHRFSLKCKTSDISYVSLIKAICNQDLGLKPSIAHRVYFINVNRKTIFHIYDDRGCDLLATSPETLKDIYNRYNDWILDYDRSKINKLFR